MTQTDTEVEARRRWMGILAQAEPVALEEHLRGLVLPAFTTLRPAEPGLVMVRGRMGGDGAPFNLGEMSVTRCAVRIDGSDVVGFAWVAGRDRRHAEHAARVDALMQTPRRDEIAAAVIAPLKASRAYGRAAAHARAQSTRVDFFTLVRGED
jgi:alpha-D-ribose 1-methylphosphonate 5-triphosphate synthase subunit PhnG